MMVHQSAEATCWPVRNKVRDTCQAPVSDSSSATSESANRQSSCRKTTMMATTKLFPISHLIKLVILQLLLANLRQTTHDEQQPLHTQPSPQTPSLVGQLARLELFGSVQFVQRALLPSSILVASGALECETDAECDSGENKEKSCHENKCICPRDRPIEDQGRCLTQNTIDEDCSVDNQCMGGSLCIGGFCSCGLDAISVWNPSTRLFYCHPKRQLSEKCNHDSQCPVNAYCSVEGSGCLCQNGYAPTLVRNSETNKESAECLPKLCNPNAATAVAAATGEPVCESEFHQCENDLCKCHATHFDPHTAKCYKFGSTAGIEDSKLLLVDNGTLLNGQQQNNNSNSNGDGQHNLLDTFYSVFRDLIQNGDNVWIVLAIVISLLVLLLVLILLICARRQSLGCGFWRARKHQEWDPNNKDNNSDKNNFLRQKDSINNKSFRRRSKEDDIEEACPCPAGDSPGADLTQSAGLLGHEAGGLGKTVKLNKVSFLSGTNKASGNEYQALNFSSKETGVKKIADDRDPAVIVATNGIHIQREHSIHSILGPITSKNSTPV